MLEILVAGLLVLLDEAAPLGLQINWSKTKIQHVGEPRLTYRTYILPVLLYGCETWTITKTLAKRLDAFDTWCLR